MYNAYQRVLQVMHAKFQSKLSVASQAIFLTAIDMRQTVDDIAILHLTVVTFDVWRDVVLKMPCCIHVCN